MHRANGLLRLLLWGATTISFLSTGLGLFVWFNAESGMWEALAFAVIWSLFLQAGIIVFWSYLGRADGLFGRTLAVALGVACSLGSMTFASAVWLMRTNHLGYEHTLSKANAITVIDPLTQWSKRVNGVATTMATVAAEASSKAQIEGSVGGTCEGAKAQKDCGPICRLRKRQQAEATKISTDLGGVAQTSTDIVSAIQGDLTREGMKAGYAKAMALERAQAITNARAWIEEQIRGFDSKFVDPQSRSTFVCRDPQFRDQLGAARESLRVDMSLPALPPEPAKVGYAEAASKSVNDVFALVSAVLTGSFNKSMLTTLQDTGVGMSIAAFIELTIIFLVLVEARDLRDRAALETAAERFIFTKRRIPPEQVRRLAQLGYLMDRFTFQSNTMRGTFFLRPLDGRADTVAKCADIVRLFDLPYAKRQVKVIAREVVDEWAIGTDDLTDGARMFEVRMLTNEVQRQRRIIARDALLLPETGNDNAPTPTTGTALVVKAS